MMQKLRRLLNTVALTYPDSRDGQSVSSTGKNIERTNMDAVIVEWLDIIGNDTWKTKSEAAQTEPQRFVTVGYLLRDDEKAVVVCSTYSFDDDTVGGITSIPKGAVTAVKPVVLERS